MMELILGVSTCTALLHYEDVIEQMRIHQELEKLADKYPNCYGYNRDFLAFLTRMILRKMLSSWSSTLNVNRVKSAMGLKPDHMAAMEEMEADNMDQNLGMENQDLSRGGFFLFLLK